MHSTLNYSSPERKKLEIYSTKRNHLSYCTLSVQKILMWYWPFLSIAQKWYIFLFDWYQMSQFWWYCRSWGEMLGGSIGSLLNMLQYFTILWLLLCMLWAQEWHVSMNSCYYSYIFKALKAHLLSFIPMFQYRNFFSISGSVSNNPL